MKWYVAIKHDPSNFFKPVSTGCYLSCIGMFADEVAAGFLPDNPVAYPGRSARFLVKELRRVGYNVYRRPWLLYVLKQRRAAKKLDPWKK